MAIAVLGSGSIEVIDGGRYYNSIIVVESFKLSGEGGCNSGPLSELSRRRLLSPRKARQI